MKIFITFLAIALCAAYLDTDADEFDYSPQYTYGMRAHAERSEAIRYAEADARRSCEMIMLIEPNTRTFPGETMLLRLKRVHNPYFDPPDRWRARVRAECDVFTTR